MTILGIDPGTTRIGFGLITLEKGVPSCLAYGVIGTTLKDAPGRLSHAAQELTTLLEKHQPDVAVVERLFFSKNQKTAMSVGEMRGVILLTLTRYGVPIQEVTPFEVKRYITGYGMAQKQQIQRVVQMILKMPEHIRSDDAADALALALCGYPPK